MSKDENVLRPGPQYIAPLTASVTPSPVGLVEGYEQMLGMLRDIRAEVQNLQNILIELIEKETITDPEIRAQEVLATLRNSQPIYDYNSEQITTRMHELRALLRAVSTLYDRYGDEITHIENYWERATVDWPYLAGGKADIQPEPAPDAEATDPENETSPAVTAMMTAAEVLRRARRVITDLDSLIYHVGLLTIPGRLNQHLEQLRIGQRLDFHGTFADEVPNAEDRQRILQYLADHPVAVSNGIMDAATGMIYHASPDLSRRRLSYVFIVLAIVVGAFLVFLISELGELFNLENWPVEAGHTASLLISYAFVITGGIVHIGVDAIKQARANSGQSSWLAIEDWFTWIHINEIGIIMGIVWLWVGFFGLLFLSGSVEWQTAFLVGYSIDSFADMFLQRFNTAAATRVGTLAF